MVLGHDPGAAPAALRERIGVVLQQSELSPLLTVRETHAMFAGYYANPRDVDEVIELVGLDEKRDARVKTLSGGQKRRLDLGVALVGNPELVFLDEPTTGFDPAARRAAWDMIRALRALGTTILLTTHYLDEAQQLADRVAVLRGGEIVRMGTPAELIGDSGVTEIRFRRDGELVRVETTDPTRALNELTTEALADGRHARAARGAPPHARGRLPRARRRGRRETASDDAAPSAPLRAEDLLAKPGGRGLHLHLPAAALRTPRVGLRRRDRRRSPPSTCSSSACSGTARRRRPSAGSRSCSWCDARPASSSGCARRRCRRPSTCSRCCSRRSPRSRCSRSRCSRSGASASARACPRTGSDSSARSCSASPRSRASGSVQPP